MTVTASRPRSAVAPPRSGGSGLTFLIGVVVLAVLAGVGYAVLTGNVPGQQPQPAQTASANPPVWALDADELIRVTFEGAIYSLTRIGLDGTETWLASFE